MDTYKDLPVMPFESAAAWRDWLDAHHTTSPGLWVRIYKKASRRPTVTYAEALDEALCYGWIDSTKAPLDEASFLQRFSPRKARSAWSQVNRGHVARLTEAGQMRPAGQKAVDEARADGRWDAAYAPQSRMAVPDDLQAALDAHPEAKAHFETLNKVNRYAILYRIQAVKKPETRLKRIDWAIDLLLKRETVH
ncbi:MAG: YdeI/OmpD-associated family protein [Candidatus Sericytochromatia bacterium]